MWSKQVIAKKKKDQVMASRSCRLGLKERYINPSKLIFFFLCSPQARQWI